LTNPAGVTGDLHDAVRGADVFIGVSAPDVLPASWISDMASSPVIFALANPDPEVDVDAAQHLAAVLATGRSDYPNQINNVLAFPGVFRGLLDAHARTITDAMLLAAADAIADVVDGAQLNASFIVPSVFDSAVAPAVAEAVAKATTAADLVNSPRLNARSSLCAQRTTTGVTTSALIMSPNHQVSQILAKLAHSA